MCVINNKIHIRFRVVIVTYPRKMKEAGRIPSTEKGEMHKQFYFGTSLHEMN